MSDCKFRPTERIGLYAMVIFILLGSCQNNFSDEEKRDLYNRLDRIEQKLDDRD